MISSFVRALVSAFKVRRELALENVALRQQLACAPKKLDPSLIPQFRAARIGRFAANG